MAERGGTAGDAQIAGIRVDIAADSGERNLGWDHDALFTDRQQLRLTRRAGYSAGRKRFAQAGQYRFGVLSAAGDGQAHPRGHKQLFTERTQRFDQLVRPCVEILLQFPQPAIVADARAALGAGTGRVQGGGGAEHRGA